MHVVYTIAVVVFGVVAAAAFLQVSVGVVKPIGGGVDEAAFSAAFDTDELDAFACTAI